MAQVAHPSSCNEKETDAKTEKMNVREGQEAAGSRYPLQYRGALCGSVAKLCPGLLTLHVIPLPCLTAWAELCFPPNSCAAIPAPRTSECDLIWRRRS